MTSMKKTSSAWIVTLLVLLAAFWEMQTVTAQTVTPVDNKIFESVDANLSTKTFHFGWKKSKNGKLPSIAEEGFQDILKKHEAIFLGNVTKKELFLTFDNGFENGYTVKILNILKEKHVPACFFVTGGYVKEAPDLLMRMVQEGHLIGNHSWGHPDMSRLPPGRIKSELDQLKTQVQTVTGQKEMPFMRPPSGIFNERLLGIARELGYTNVFWSIAYENDWDPKRQRGWKYAFNKVVNQLHPGAVIMLHSVSRDNTEAIAEIIDEARRQGYEFKSLNQLSVKNY